MRGLLAAVVALGGCWLARAAHAQPTPPPAAGAPDLDLLEYLGSWQGDDEEWVAVEELGKREGPSRERDERRQAGGREADPPKDDDDESR